MASIDGKHSLQVLDIQEHQLLKDLEDQVIDARLDLDSTADTISSVAEMYKQFCRDSPAISQDVNDDEFDLISFSLQEKQRDIIQNRKKFEALHVKVQGTVALVRFCCFLILNCHTSDIKQFSYPAFWTFETEFLSKNFQKRPEKNSRLYDSLLIKAREMLLLSRYLQS